jgi:hypothetical protein
MGSGAQPEGGWWQDEKGRWRESPRSRRLRDLLPGLVFHLVGAGTWLTFLGVAALFSPASNRQFNEVGLIAAATWLVAAFLIVWLSWSGKPDKVILWIPVAWWVPSFLWAISVLY